MKSEAYSISATDIEIWAKIGVHAEEALVENCFRVSVVVDAAMPYTNHSYIDYELIADKVKLVFGRPQRVLEEVCVQVIDELKNEIEHSLKSISCEVRKLEPALNGLKVGSLSASITKYFE